MPKATLEFQLPDELAEFRAANNGDVYSSLIWEFTNELRSKNKYSKSSPTWDEVNQMWRNMLEGYDINPYA